MTVGVTLGAVRGAVRGFAEIFLYLLGLRRNEK